MNIFDPSLPLVIPFAGLFGLFIGSFLNVLVDRMFTGEDFVHGRSHCDYCGRHLGPAELIPVLSWLLQGGKSRCCHKRLSIQYPLMELVTGAGTAIVASSLVGTNFIYPEAGTVVILALRLLIFWNALVIFVSDARHQLIPLPSLVAGILFGTGGVIATAFFSGTDPKLALISAILSGISAAVFFFILWAGSRGRAMGDGDIYLAAMIGIITGFPGVIFALYLAFLTGAIWGVILIFGGKKRFQSHIPFGPFLLFGLGLALVFYPALFQWWRNVWGL